MGHGGETLTKLIPARRACCPHRLGRWLLASAKSTATFPDGNFRPPGRRGGRLVVAAGGCVFVPGHPGVHRDEEGRAWT